MKQDATELDLTTAHGIGEVLNARGPLWEDEHSARIPQVAYAWHLDRYGDWVREDAEEYGCERGAMVFQRDGEETWRGLGSGEFVTAEDAKAACDAALVARGWLLDETSVRPDRETIAVRRCVHGEAHDTFCAACGLKNFVEPTKPDQMERRE